MAIKRAHIFDPAIAPIDTYLVVTSTPLGRVDGQLTVELGLWPTEEARRRYQAIAKQIAVMQPALNAGNQINTVGLPPDMGDAGTPARAAYDKARADRSALENAWLELNRAYQQLLAEFDRVQPISLRPLRKVPTQQGRFQLHELPLRLEYGVDITLELLDDAGRPDMDKIYARLQASPDYAGEMV